MDQKGFLIGIWYRFDFIGFDQQTLEFFATLVFFPKFGL